MNHKEDDLEDLTGSAQLLLNKIQFRHFYFEHVGHQGRRDRIFYLDRRKWINLHECGQVQGKNGDCIFIYMLDGSKIVLKPDNFNLWMENLPEWICKIRQVSLWSVRLDYECNCPSSWGKKKGPNGLDWDRLWFRWNLEQWEYLKKDDGKHTLGIKVIQTDTVILQSGCLLEVGHWTIKFETKKLAAKWCEFLKRQREGGKYHISFPAIEDELEENTTLIIPEMDCVIPRPAPLLASQSSKMNSMKMIEEIRQTQLKKRNSQHRRLSIGEEYDDEE